MEGSGFRRILWKFELVFMTHSSIFRDTETNNGCLTKAYTIKCVLYLSDEPRRSAICFIDET